MVKLELNTYAQNLTKLPASTSQKLHIILIIFISQPIIPILILLVFCYLKLNSLLSSLSQYLIQFDTSNHRFYSHLPLIKPPHHSIAACFHLCNSYSQKYPIILLSIKKFQNYHKNVTIHRKTCQVCTC